MILNMNILILSHEVLESKEEKVTYAKYMYYTVLDQHIFA